MITRFFHKTGDNFYTRYRFRNAEHYNYWALQVKPNVSIRKNKPFDLEEVFESTKYYFDIPVDFTDAQFANTPEEFDPDPKITPQELLYGYLGLGTAVPFNTAFKHVQINPMAANAYRKYEPEKPKALSDIKIGDLFTYPTLSKYEGLQGKIPVRAGTTYVGVEIELEKVNFKSAVPNTCNVTEDGSLKDNGAELVTIPIQFKYLEVELQRTLGSLQSSHVSQRCSIHVHLNVRDFSLEELQCFTALYMIFEKSLYNYSGNRWNNIFCVPLAMNTLIVKNFFNKVQQGYIPNENNSWYKYFGFNLSPIYGGESTRIGTIEFRHMCGTTDIKWIINWINLIVSLKISAKNMKYAEIVQHLETMNTTSGYYWLVKTVFKDFANLISTQPTFKEDVESSISRAKQVFLKEDNTTQSYIQIKRG